MSGTIWLSLLHNTALLLAIALLIDLVPLRWHTRIDVLRQVSMGLALGVIGIALMLTPWVPVPGIIFDTRSILLGTAGLFLGTIPAAVAMLITAAFRLYQGGGGALTGVLVIAATGGLGIAWRHLRRGPLDEIRWRELYLFGLLIHIVMLVIFFSLPRESVLPILTQITLPVLLIYPLGTALLGALMANRLRRERTAAELRSRGEQLSLAIRASNIGFFESDLVTGKGRFSPEWKKQIGYADDEIANNSQEWESRIHPDDLPATLAQLNGYIEGLRPEYEAEYRLRHKDGTYRWILARGMLQFDQDGRAVRLLGSHIDITNQKQSERLYRILTENIQDVVWILDTETMYFRYVSPSVERLRGYTPAEIQAEPMDHAVTPAVKEQLNDLIRQRVEAFRSGQEEPDRFYTEEVEQRCKDGSTVWTEVVTSYYRNSENGHIEVRGVTHDIRARRQAEEALRESEDKFRYMFDHSVVGKSITLTSGQINVNRAFCDMLGYSPEELQNKRWQEITYPEDIEPTQREVDEILSGVKESCRFIKRFIHKNGELVWVDLSSSLRRDSQGKPLYLLSTLLDITVHKRAEEVLRETKAILQAAFDNSQAGIAIADAPDGRLRYVNQAGLLIPNRGADEIVDGIDIAHYVESWHIFHLDGTPFQADEVPLARAVLYGERCSKEFIIRRENLEDRIVLADAGPIFDESGQVKAGIVIFLDITERKRAEEELRNSEENYRLLFEQAADGIFISDLQGNYVDVNSSGCALLGYTREEILNLNMSDLVTPKSQKTSPLRIQDLKTGQFTFSERQMRRKDGILIDVEISASRLADGRVLGMARDITARKRAEEKAQAAQVELQRLLEEADQSRQVLLSLVEDQKQAQEQIRSLNSALEQRVRERTLQLESANKELEAFSYSVSHDLRAPLRAMDGFSAALLQDYPGQLDEKGRHYLERIQEASRRMGQLINDLLSLSRVTRSEFKRQQVDLSGLAREIAADFHAQNAPRQVEVEIASDLIVRGDAHLLKIALENLINNAFKFTGKVEEARVQVGALEQSGEMVYFVRDNGVGFDMNYAGKLFAPFQRLHGMQEFPGTGIGLVTVQRIIQRHGGRIWPEAAPNQGATFYFTLGGA